MLCAKCRSAMRIKSRRYETDKSSGEARTVVVTEYFCPNRSCNTTCIERKPKGEQKNDQ